MHTVRILHACSRIMYFFCELCIFSDYAYSAYHISNILFKPPEAKNEYTITTTTTYSAYHISNTRSFSARSDIVWYSSNEMDCEHEILNLDMLPSGLPPHPSSPFS